MKAKDLVFRLKSKLFKKKSSPVVKIAAEKSFTTFLRSKVDV